jgi:hypothetical protein
MRGDPPRHVRDIAHLYLSRMRRTGGGPVRFVVAGMSADVIPGFHVANLALAAAARGIAVRIEERSGLPVNAGCFLGLDPSCWVAREDGPVAPVAAFARVTFSLSSERGSSSARDSSTESGERLEMVHVPPFDAGLDHPHALSVAISSAVPTAVLYLAEYLAEPRPWREMGEREGVVRRVAYVTRAGQAGAEDGCVGVLVRWKRSLTDPLPVMVRDPDSRLARQYTDAMSKLLAGATPSATVDARARLVHPHAAPALEPR